MAKKKLKILFLFDLGEKPPESEAFNDLLKTEDWKPESIIIKAIKSLGHDVKPFALFDNIQPLIKEISENKPDLIFNQCEAFTGDREFEPNIVSLCELFRIPYTGASPHALEICKDKGLTKQILSYHRIRVPKFIVSKKFRPIRKIHSIKFPTFIKPLNLEASEGIAQLSFTENEKDTIERVRYIHEKFDCDAIIEEYINGRELYVGVLGNKQLQVLPPRELFFNQVPEGEPKFATFKAKWDEQYRKKWGIKSGSAKPISEKTEKRILETSRKIYKLFQIRGYARIDFRLSEDDDLVFIEANPNPSLVHDEDFALSAEKAGISYEDLIDQIINLAFLA